MKEGREREGGRERGRVYVRQSIKSKLAWR